MCSKRDLNLRGEARWRQGVLCGWREGEGRGGPVTEWVVAEVCSQKEVSSRLMWVRVEIERESWVFSEKSEEELEEFWNELSECVGSFGRNESVVVHGDLYVRVGNEVIVAIVGQHGVPGRNESGERLLEKCAEQELVVGNSWFNKYDVYKYK